MIHEDLNLQLTACNTTTRILRDKSHTLIVVVIFMHAYWMAIRSLNIVYKTEPGMRHILSNVNITSNSHVYGVRYGVGGPYLMSR